MLIFKDSFLQLELIPLLEVVLNIRCVVHTPSGILLNGTLLGDKWRREISAFTKLKSNNIPPCSYAQSRCLSAIHAAFLHNNVFMNQLHYCLAISFMSWKSEKKPYFCIFLSYFQTLLFWTQDNFSDNVHQSSVEGTVTVLCTPSSMS